MGLLLPLAALANYQSVTANYQSVTAVRAKIPNLMQRKFRRLVG